MSLLAGIDLGTSVLKGVIIDLHGKILCTRKISVHYDHETAYSVEFSATEFYDRFCRLIKDLLSAVSNPEQVIAISISGATGNTLLLDRKNKPVS